VKALHTFYLQQQFLIHPLSILLNPFFFIRLSLLKAIKRHSFKLKGNLLDFGCGRKPYQTLFNVESYIGVDVEVSGHNHAKEAIDVYYDGRKLPFEDHAFDSIFSSETFEHVFNLEEMIPELYRVLKPGGQMLITVPFVWDEHEIPFDYGRYSSFGIRYLLEKNGFQVESLDKTGHFFLVLGQLWILYLYNLVHTRFKYLNLLIQILLLAPFNVLVGLLSLIAPKHKGLYFNNVVLASKR
jgi:SAM-dependent methyltransferase